VARLECGLELRLARGTGSASGQTLTTFHQFSVAEDARFELARRCHQHAFQVCGRVFAEARDRPYLGNLNLAGSPRTVLDAGE